MYTYLIGWSTHNKYYYGVRYSKKATPSDLWTTYFTSSKHVKHFAAKHGDPDIKQIRKVFADRESAICWENTVLRRLKVVEDHRFLNATYNTAIRPTQHNRILNLQHRKRFRQLDESVQRRLKKQQSERMTAAWARGDRTGEKTGPTDKYSAAAKRRWANDEFKALAKSRRWITNGVEQKFIPKEQLSSYLSSGWVFGRGGY